MTASVAKVVHIVSSSDKSFDDAVRQGIATASHSVRGITGAKICDSTVKVDDKVTSYKVTLDVAFAVEERSEE